MAHLARADTAAPQLIAACESSLVSRETGRGTIEECETERLLKASADGRVLASCQQTLTLLACAGAILSYKFDVGLAARRATAGV
jgi:hypothetical protein